VNLRTAALLLSQTTRWATATSLAAVATPWLSHSLHWARSCSRSCLMHALTSTLMGELAAYPMLSW